MLLIMLLSGASMIYMHFWTSAKHRSSKCYQVNIFSAQTQTFEGNCSCRTSMMSAGPSHLARFDKSFWIKINFYIAHLLLSWCAGSWEFAIGLFFVILSPDENLRLSSINQFLSLLVVILLVPLVGKWIDASKRITSMRVSIFMDNGSVSLCCVILYFVSRSWEVQGKASLTWGLLALSVVFCCVGTLANTAGVITLQRDWVVLLCDAGHADLTTLNAVLKQIDLVCNVVAPILTGYLMTSMRIQRTSMVLAGIYATAAIIACLLLNNVHNKEPSFSSPKLETNRKRSSLIEKRGSKGGLNNETGDVERDAGCSLSNRNETQLQNYSSIEMSHGSLLSVARSSQCERFNIFSTFLDSFTVYRSYPIRSAAIALAILFLTTLTFHFATTGYLLLHGMTETYIAIVAAAGSISGFLGTYLFLYLKRRFGLERGAVCGILLQLVCLTFSVVALWLPYGKSDKTFSCAKLGLGTSTNCAGFATLMMFCGGIIVSRAGLWVFDLSVVQMIQESVPPAFRGRFNGFQHALQSFFEIKQIILVIIFPEVSTYRWLGLVSYISVLTAFLIYLHYYQNKREAESEIQKPEGFLKEDKETSNSNPNPTLLGQ